MCSYFSRWLSIKFVKLQSPDLIYLFEEESGWKLLHFKALNSHRNTNIWCLSVFLLAAESVMCAFADVLREWVRLSEGETTVSPLSCLETSCLRKVNKDCEEGGSPASNFLHCTHKLRHRIIPDTQTHTHTWTLHSVAWGKVTNQSIFFIKRERGGIKG